MEKRVYSSFFFVVLCFLKFQTVLRGWKPLNILNLA